MSKKVLLAVSGGIDSMCMADIYSHGSEDFAIAHCNFHLRGEDSNADAELVRKWAAAHGVRFFQADFDTEAFAEEHGISIEMAAREQRYAWFSFIAETQGFDAVATAHNANDNAETLILNLLRGTGSRGLRCMSCSSRLPDGQLEIRLIRPMLGMSRKEIEAYAEEHGVRYREDRTNAETLFKRNRIRNIIFPEFEKINPSFIRTINEDIARFREVDDIAEEWYLENAGRVFDGKSIDINALLGLKHWKYMLFRILEPFGFNAQVFDSMVRTFESFAEGKEMTLSGKRFHADEFFLETSSGRAVLLKTKADGDGAEAMEVTVAGSYGFNGRTVIVEDLEHSEGMSLKSEKGDLLCDAKVLGYPFTLRRWESGDWMHPFGMGGKAKKVSDLFTDLKLSISDKEAAIAVYSPALSQGDGSHVAAIAGYRMDEALRITKGSKHIIKLSLV